MLLLVQNRILTQNRPITWLTANTAVAATTFTVKAVDNTQWADNDWVIVGEIGTPNAEVLQINGAVSDGVSLTLDNAGSGGSRFTHSVDEPVYRIDFNKVRFSYNSANSSTGSSTLSTVELMPNNFDTFYEDMAHDSGYGFARFFNSFTNAFSPYSDGIPYTGQSAKSLAKMITKCRSLMDEQDDDFISDSEIKAAINDKQRDILDERLWTFNEIERSTSSIQYQFSYDKPTIIKTLYSVMFGTQPLRSISKARWQLIHWDTTQNSNTPTHVAVWNNQCLIYPNPMSSAQTTNLNGGISASDTTITCDSVTGFLVGDYYRFTVGSEIIYATFANPSTNQFTGCIRGAEDTTAASHLDDALLTQNDIVFNGQKEPQDLEELNDETVIPESIVICYGVSADFCNGKLQKPTLGDRYNVMYEKGTESLRNKYAIKISSQFGRVMDPREVIKDNGRIQNPNDFPQNVIAPPIQP